MVEQCPQCLYDSRHPFGLTLIKGECSGCHTHREKDQLDWSQRYQLLQQRLASRRHRGTYDCVVPVCGDAEDYYVLDQVLKLGLHPLVVVVNDYFMNDIGWHNLHNLITHFDVDSMVYNPDMRAYQELIRTCLRKLNHLLWPALALRTAYPMHVAHDRGIPWVITGQLQAVEQVGKFSHTEAADISQWSRLEHDLFNQSVEAVIGTGAQLQDRVLAYYRYPAVASLAKVGVQGVYLSNYLRWDPLAQNRLALTQGYQPQRQSSTFDCYERAGSSVYYQLHDLLKFKRHGYRKVTDHLVRERRHGRITLDEAQGLQHHYLHQKVNIRPFFDWLGVTESGYQWFVEHQLGDVKPLVGEPDAAPKLPQALADMLETGSDPSRDFIPFAKGI
ncbi:N-acetyl sugar amidotransferase [Saccharospirillum sp. HFRX-1]|uniref:N-acetyl sugar amidotransferase n=1 Tax=unclassified Saccharospirillum TaxID=2633430 RepID=UPI00371C9E7E